MGKEIIALCNHHLVLAVSDQSHFLRPLVLRDAQQRDFSSVF